MRHLLAIAVHDRGDVSYLGNTIKGVEASGGWPVDNRFLMMDGPYHHEDTHGWDRVDLPTRQMATRARWALFREALQRGADFLTVLEDDVTFCRNAMTKIRTTTVPPALAFISWFSSGIRPEHESPGTYVIPVPGYQWAQAMTFSAATLVKLTGCHLNFNGLGPNTPDSMLGVLLPAAFYARISPSIIQHVGERSVVVRTPLSQRAGAVSYTFHPDFDAFDLAPIPDVVTTAEIADYLPAPIGHLWRTVGPFRWQPWKFGYTVRPYRGGALLKALYGSAEAARKKQLFNLRSVNIQRGFPDGSVLRLDLV
jgi:hypothetical protein